MPVSERTFRQIALEDPDGKWELDCGRLRQKSAMTWEHARIAWRLGFRLQQQLDVNQFEVRVDAGHVQRSDVRFFIPDVIVIPLDVAIRTFTTPGMLAVYAFPLPLVAEVWSPSTGDHDATTKLQEYQTRGDHEIWLLHPYERRLSAWRRQPDGTYTPTEFQGGTVRPAALPAVVIDLDELFGLAQG